MSSSRNRIPQSNETIDIAPAATQLAPIAAGAIVGMEIDKQIATAKQYPRSLARVQANAMALVDAHLQMSNKPEDGLYYSFTRGGKIIEGPNVRIAEIIQHTYGNSRAGARPTGADEKYVFAEGVFHDLETNTAVRFEVKRKILDKDGNRYSDDMVGVTENAASAIAYRNAVLKGIPKALWWPMYLRARGQAGGATKAQTADRRNEAMEFCEQHGISSEAIFKKFGVKKVTDLTPAHLATLKGILTAIAHKETTVAREFGGEPAVSDVKSATIDENSPISQNQLLDANTLIADFKVTEANVKVAMAAAGYSRGALATMPRKYFNAFVQKLEKMGRK